MQDKVNKKEQYIGNINIIDFINKLINSKKLLIISTIIFLLPAILFSYQLQPKYKSTAVIEIGHFKNSVEPIDLFESAENLIQDLKLNLVTENQDNGLYGNVQISKIQDRLVKIEFSSNSKNINSDIMNNFINYSIDRHSELSSSKLENSKNKISRELDEINSEILNVKTSLLNNMENELFMLSSQLPFIDKKIDLLKKIIRDDTDNLEKLATIPELLIARAAISPSLEEKIYNYNNSVIKLEKSKIEISNQIHLLENELDIFDEKIIFSDVLKSRFKKQQNLKHEIKKINDTEVINTNLVGSIKSTVIEPKKKLLVLLGLLSGLLFGIFLVLVKDSLSFKEISK